MTVSSTTNRVSFSANGSTTVFPVSYPFQSASDLAVIVTDSLGNQTTKSLGSDYTVSGTQDGNGIFQNGGSVTFTVAPASGMSITILRDPPLTQVVAFVDNDPLPAASLSTPVDKLTMLTQRSRDLVTRSLRQPDGDTTTIAALPPAATRANGGLGSVMGFDGSGNPTVLPSAANGVQVSTAMAPVVNSATLAAARTTMGIPFSNYAAPNATPYTIQVPADAGTLFSSVSMGGAGTFNLPAAATAVKGTVYAFIRETNNLIIACAGADKIVGPGSLAAPGVSSLTLSYEGDSIAIESTGSGWKAISASANIQFANASSDAGKVLTVGASGGLALATPEPPQPGQVRLVFVSSTQIKLAPYGGNGIRIAGVNYGVPSAGIISANTNTFINGVAGQNLAASTLYYVYLFNNSGTLALDFSTTGHATDSTTGNVGVEIKTGDNSRTLVGMVFTGGSGQFVSSAAAQNVASWFNRQSRPLTGAAINQTSTSVSWVELNTTGRVEFVSWADEAVAWSLMGWTLNSVSGINTMTSVGLDGGASGNLIAPEFATSTAPAANGATAVGLSGSTTVTEGHHFLTPAGEVSANTGTWNVALSGAVRS